MWKKMMTRVLEAAALFFFCLAALGLFACQKHEPEYMKGEIVCMKLNGQKVLIVDYDESNDSYRVRNSWFRLLQDVYPVELKRCEKKGRK